MTKEIRLFAEFQCPGILFAEMWKEKISSLDPYAVKWPDNAYAFRIFQREDIIEDGETFQGKEKQIGPTYYHPDSRIETLASIEARNDPKEEILRSNMRGNKWNSVVWTRWGNFPQPFDSSKDKVLSSYRNELKEVSKEVLKKVASR